MEKNQIQANTSRAVLQERAKGYYIWQTENDSAVRPSHAERDDRIFRWDDPLEGGHPGEGFN